MGETMAAEARIRPQLGSTCRDALHSAGMLLQARSMGLRSAMEQLEVGPTRAGTAQGIHHRMAALAAELDALGQALVKLSDDL